MRKLLVGRPKASPSGRIAPKVVRERIELELPLIKRENAASFHAW